MAFALIFTLNPQMMPICEVVGCYRDTWVFAGGIGRCLGEEKVDKYG